MSLEVEQDQNAFSPLHPCYSQLYEGNAAEHEAGIVALMERVLPLKLHEKKFPGIEWPPGNFNSLATNPLPLQIVASLLYGANPKHLLEVGTFVGISAMYFAEAMPPGSKVTTLEKYDVFANVAKRNVAKFGFSEKIDVVNADAFEWIGQQRSGSFDAVYLDGNKERYDAYFEALDPLIPVGGLLIVDNVFQSGDVFNKVPKWEKTPGVLRLLDAVAKRSDYHKSLLPVCDGTLIMRKLAM